MVNHTYYMFLFITNQTQCKKKLFGLENVHAMHFVEDSKNMFKNLKMGTSIYYFSLNKYF